MKAEADIGEASRAGWWMVLAVWVALLAGLPSPAAPASEGVAAAGGTAADGTLLGRISGGQLILSWPTNQGSQRVEQASDLAVGHWEEVVASPVLSGARWELRVPTQKPQSFYRLAPESYAVWNGVLNRLDEMIRGLTVSETNQRLASIAAFLSAQPEFAAAGVAESTRGIWARTPAGEVLCVVDGLTRASTGLTSVVESVDDPLRGVDSGWANAGGIAEPAARSGISRRLAQPVSRIELPAGRRIHIASVDHVKDWLHKNALAPYFYAAGTHRYEETFGPKVRELFPNGGIERLASLSDVGVFYMHSVVSAGRLLDGTEVAALLTSVDVTPATEPVYRRWLRDGSLVLMDIPNVNQLQSGGPDRLRRFGMTSKFIRERVRLAPDALVYVDAGYGNHEDLKRAFLDVGASLYLSWEKMPSTDDIPNKSAVYFFLHSMNEDLHVTFMPWLTWPDSPTRAFDCRSVYASLMGKGIGRDTGGRLVPMPSDPQLVLTEGAGRLGLLAPSIAYVKVDETPTNALPEMAVMELHGSFGSDPGLGSREVVLTHSRSPSNGEPLEVLSWTPSLLRVVVPAKPGSGFTGGRVIVVARGVRSNAVPLTEWVLPVRMFSRDARTGYYDEAAFSLHIRLDVHGYRSAMNQPYPLPAPPRALYAESNSVGRFSAGTWVSGGTYTDNNSDDPQVPDTLWFRQRGSGVFRYTAEVVGPVSAFHATATPVYASPTLDVPKPPVRIAINLNYRALGKKSERGFIDTGTGAWSEPVEVLDTPLVSPISGDPRLPPGWNFEVELDGDYSIKPGSFQNLSWGRTPPSEHSAPDELDLR